MFELSTNALPPKRKKEVIEIITKNLKSCSTINAENLQKVWTQKEKGRAPYEIVDMVGNLSKAIVNKIRKDDLSDDATKFIYEVFDINSQNIRNGKRKLAANGM